MRHLPRLLVHRFLDRYNQPVHHPIHGVLLDVLIHADYRLEQRLTKARKSFLICCFIWTNFLLRQLRPKQYNFLPVELFPARFWSTCHGLSAASGKAGVIIGAFVVQMFTVRGTSSQIKHSMLALAFTNMLGFCCTFLVTETKGRSLEEISGEDGGRDESKIESQSSREAINVRIT